MPDEKPWEEEQKDDNDDPMIPEQPIAVYDINPAEAAQQDLNAFMQGNNVPMQPGLLPNQDGVPHQPGDDEVPPMPVLARQQAGDVHGGPPPNEAPLDGPHDQHGGWGPGQGPNNSPYGRNNPMGR